MSLMQVVTELKTCTLRNRVFRVPSIQSSLPRMRTVDMNEKATGGKEGGELGGLNRRKVTHQKVRKDRFVAAGRSRVIKD